MDEQREEAEATVELGPDVIGWWSMGTNRIMEDRVERLQQLASGLHRAYSEACHGQFEAATVANECVTRSVQGLLGGRRPDEFFTLQTEILSGLMKATSLQMKAWSEFNQSIQDCYMDVARSTTTDIGQEARQVTSEVEQHVEQTIRATRQRIRRVAKEADEQSAGT